MSLFRLEMTRYNIPSQKFKKKKQNKKQKWGLIFWCPTRTPPPTPSLILTISFLSWPATLIHGLLLFFIFSQHNKHSSLSLFHTLPLVPLHTTISTIIFPARSPEKLLRNLFISTCFFKVKNCNLFGGFICFC